VEHAEHVASLADEACVPPITQKIQSRRSRIRPSASSSTGCPFHASMRVACAMTTASIGVWNSRRTSARSMRTPAMRLAGIGAYITCAGAPGYRTPAVEIVSRLTPSTRSGGTRLAQRSVQCSPVMRVWSHVTRRTPARRTAGPKSACDHPVCVMAASKRPRTSSARSRRRARQIDHGYRARTGPSQ
jgi:hypothetical protein